MRLKKIKNYIFIILLFFSFFVNSQTLKRNDLLGKWKYKVKVKNSKINIDSINKIYNKKVFEFNGIIFTRDTVQGILKERILPNLIITNSKFYKGNDLLSKYWKVFRNKILLYRQVPKKELAYYKKYTEGVIKKHSNGNYYFTHPTEYEILSLSENELIIKRKYYNYIYNKL